MIDFSSMFYTLFDIAIGLIKIILLPIDNLILAVLPDLSSAFSGIGALFNLIGQSLGWCISLLGISPRVIALLVAYYTFKLTVPVQVYFVKLVLDWYYRLKL